MDAEMTELICLERDGPIGILRFLQPGKRNPYSIAFVKELVTLLQEADQDDTIRAVIMTGGEHFSSGGDLVGFQSEVARGARATSEMVDKVHDGGRAAYLFRKPLISAVCGVAYGAGLSLALSADIVVAAEDARLCEVFARVGGCPDTGSSWLLQQRAGAGVARMLVLTGREIDGRTAKDLRVVEECVSAEHVEARALEIAWEIAPHPMFGVQTAKRVMRSSAECGYLDALDIERDAQSVLLCAHDFPEAMKAFSEKRKPEFKDR